MTADSQKDIESLKAINHICAETMRKMMDAPRAGITTRELDKIGRVFLVAEGSHSAPQVMYKFPGATCISVSPVIAHGIPNEYVLREGELIHFDVSAELDGYYADAGESLIVSKRDRTFEKLLSATKCALKKALHSVKAGTPLNGIGKKWHGAPVEIPNYYNPRDQLILHEGLVLVIEPFLQLGWGISAKSRMAGLCEHQIVPLLHTSSIRSLSRRTNRLFSLCKWISISFQPPAKTFAMS